LKLVTLAEEVAVDKDRVAIERLIADDYHFTSPIDNSLDRETYFEVCWPNSKAMIGFDYIYQTEDRNRAFIVYEGRTDSGKAFRNCEVHTIRDGQLVAWRSISAGTSRTNYPMVSTSTSLMSAIGT
jgi:hypothetical protein